MDLYILDSLFRRTKVIDDFESLIWTERWQEVGDFELETKASLTARGDFYPGTFLATNKSNRVMLVEQVETSLQGGERVIKVNGRSLESLIENRTAQQTLFDVTSDPYWAIYGTAIEVAEGMFDHVVRPVPALNANDTFPFLQPGSIYPPGTIPAPAGEIRWDQRPASLLSAIQDVCKSYGLGYRFVRKQDTSELYFDVYTGNDRTTNQDLVEAVIFSPSLGTFENVREYMSIRGEKNVAYVQSELGVQTVYAPSVIVPAELADFDRRVMHVRANFVSADPPADVSAALEQIGLEALAQSQRTYLFDGVVPPDTPYIYGVDYEVGDLVEVHNEDGVVSHKRITEQIFVCDQEGERDYPSLSQGTYFGADDWLGWSSSSDAWEDITISVWAEM